MLTLSRQLVRQIRILFSRALEVPRRQLDRCAVMISAGAHGLTVRAQINGGAAEYRETTPQPPVDLVTSLHQFYCVEGTKPEPVTLVKTDDGHVTARWQEGAIPRALSSEPLNLDPKALVSRAPFRLVGKSARAVGGAGRCPGNDRSPQFALCARLYPAARQ